MTLTPAEHTPRFTRRLLGYKAVGRGGLYGTDIRCSCGWTQKTNEDLRRAKVLWQAHVDGQGSARFGFGPARVR